MIEQSVFLWGLPLLILPWILRLIKTQKPLVVHFSQSYLLKKVIDTYRPKKRKNPWWLILLRMLILLTLIFLIAGILIPQLRSRGPISLILLIDDSLYSRAQQNMTTSVWEDSINQAIDKLSEFSLQTKVALVTTTGDSSPWLSLNQAKTMLADKPASFKLENWNRVKGKLQRLLRKREHDDLQLIMIGDGKSTQPEGFTSSLSQWPNNNIEFIDIHDSQNQNYAIVASAKPNAESTLLDIYINGPTEDTELQLEVSNGKGHIENKTLLWKGQPNYTTWKLKGRHWKHGKLSLKLKDKFEFDNHVYFNIEESNFKQLILLQHQQAEKRLQDSGYYLEKALKGLAFKHNFEFRSISPRGWSSLTGGKGDLLILHDPPFLSKVESEKIVQFIRRGGHAMIMSGPLTSPDELHSSLGDYLPAQLKEQSRQKLKLDLPEDWKQKLPRMAETTLKGNWLFYQLKQDAKVIMRLTDGSPFWTKHSLGQGEIHLMSSPFHIMYSDTLIRNDVLTLLDLLTKSALGSGDQDQVKLVAGEAIPDSIESVLPVFSDQTNFNPDFVYPGIYEIQDSGKSSYLSCNAPSLVDSERLPIPKQLENQQNLASISTASKRIDIEMVIILLFLILCEVFALHQMQKPNLIQKV